MINTDINLNRVVCLFQALKKVNPKYPFSILITEGVSEGCENILKHYGIDVILTESDQQIIWGYYNTWPCNKELHLLEKYTVCYEHLEYYLKKLKYKLYSRKNNHINILAIHFAALTTWLIAKK